MSYLEYAGAGVVGCFAAGDLPGEVADFTEGRGKSSYLTNHLLMILGAEFFYRALSKRRVIPIGPALTKRSGEGTILTGSQR